VALQQRAPAAAADEPAGERADQAAERAGEGHDEEGLQARPEVDAQQRGASTPAARTPA
jgi:hypothetical protein